MNKFTPLSKEQTKLLEETSVSYLMILDNLKLDPKTFVLDFHNWHSNDFLLMNSGLYKKVNYIADKLKLKQTYYINYCVKNAAWGIQFKGKEYLLYYSNEGLSLQCDKTVNSEDIVSFMQEVIKKW